MSRSDSLATRRTFHIIRALQRGPANKAELQKFVIEQEGEDAYGNPSRLTKKTLDERFRKDRERAWNQFGIEIDYDRSERVYRIVDVKEHGWLDLPDDALITLVFLQETFQEEAPQGKQVRTLLEKLTRFLPAERRLLVERKHPAPSLDLRVLDRGKINHLVFQKVQQAVQTRHLLIFNYLSPRQKDGKLRQHKVEPYALRFRDGHWYLYSYWLESRSHYGTYYREKHFSVRLSYIQPEGLLILPDIFPIVRPEPTRTLRYLLHPDLARGDISHHFPNTKIEKEKHQIGDQMWAEVTADLSASEEFRATQILFRYAQKCKVLEPDSMVRQIRKWMNGMVKLYEEEGSESP